MEKKKTILDNRRAREEYAIKIKDATRNNLNKKRTTKNNYLINAKKQSNWARKEKRVLGRGDIEDIEIKLQKNQKNVIVPDMGRPEKPFKFGTQLIEDGNKSKIYF